MNHKRILDLYRSMPYGVRLHVAGRWRLCPFPALIQEVSPVGPLFDIGCGYGLWCFYVSDQLKIPIIGVDLDSRKISVAETLARQQSQANLVFKVGDMLAVQPAECATITVIDVMYLIPYVQQELMVQKAWDCLKPGGRLLIKEMGHSPAWKYAWNLLEELLAVRLFRITMGQNFYFRPEAGWVKLLEVQGFRTTVRRLDAGYLHPHVLYTGEKP